MQTSTVEVPELLVDDELEHLVNDLKARVKQEKAAWPYAWVAGQNEYPPAAERGSVSGRLVVKDALKPALNAALMLLRAVVVSVMGDDRTVAM